MRYSEDLAIPGVWNLPSVGRHKETKTNEGSRIVYITEKAAHQHAHNVTFGLFAAVWLFRLTGWFHIHQWLMQLIKLFKEVAFSQTY